MFSKSFWNMIKYLMLLEKWKREINNILRFISSYVVWRKFENFTNELIIKRIPTTKSIPTTFSNCIGNPFTARSNVNTSRRRRRNTMLVQIRQRSVSVYYYTPQKESVGDTPNCGTIPVLRLYTLELMKTADTLMRL